MGSNEHTYDLVIRADRVVTAAGERPAAVAVRGGTIAYVGDLEADLTAPIDLRLAADEVLIPGVVDGHVHVNEPGRTEWEGFATATRAAAAGGTTTIVDMPLNSIPSTTTPEALRTKLDAATGQLTCDVAFVGGAVPQNIGALRPLSEAGVVAFKSFLAPSGVDEFEHISRDQLRAHLGELATFDGVLMVHAEDPDVLEAAPVPDGRSYDAFVGSRPQDAEVTAIEWAVATAQQTGARLHIVHVASADALPVIAAAKRDGVRITAETCPHYLTFTAEQIPDGATQYKCCPPIRDKAVQEALWDGLRAGTLDWVASDHSPATVDVKGLDTGDFETAWGGIASVELLLRAVWTGARARGVALSDVVGWVCERPAAHLGLARKGRIEPGYDADFVVFAPEQTQLIDVHRLHHKNPVTPYDAVELAGGIRATYLRGRLVDLDQPHGRAVLAHS